MPTVQPEILLSIYKPILLALIVGLWAYAVSYLDKDLAGFHLRRQTVNGIQVGLGVLALWLWLIIPFFWLGLASAVLLMAMGLVGYHFYRNSKIPPEFHWSFSLDSFKARISEMKKEHDQKEATLRLLTAQGEVLQAPLGEHPQAKAHATFTSLMEFAIPRNAEKIELLTDPKQATVTVQIDGVRYPQANLQPVEGLAITDYLKQAAGLDVADRRRKQAGPLKFIADGLGQHTLALQTSGTTRGLSLTAEIDPGGFGARKFEELGLLESQAQQLVAALDQPGRLVMVACPPGQGLTTTLYSLTARHDPYTLSVLTLEEKIEHELEGVNQETIKTGPEAPKLDQQLNTLVLREPNVLMLSFLSDPDVAKLIVRHSGDIRFYAGLRQSDTLVALRAWAQAVGDPASAAKAVGAVITQRLVRQVCMTCRLAYKPDADLLRKLNLPADRVGQFYKHSGQVLEKDKPIVCPTCLGLGYKGRLAVFEVMALDDEARALAAAGRYDQLKAHLRKKRMLLLQEAAMARVVEGRTTIGEITRMLGGK